MIWLILHIRTLKVTGEEFDAEDIAQEGFPKLHGFKMLY